MSGTGRPETTPVTALVLVLVLVLREWVDAAASWRTEQRFLGAPAARLHRVQSGLGDRCRGAPGPVGPPRF